MIPAPPQQTSGLAYIHAPTAGVILTRSNQEGGPRYGMPGLWSASERVDRLSADGSSGRGFQVLPEVQ